MREECLQCELYKLADTPCIQGRGQLDESTDLFLIGEAPGYEENCKGKVFIGRAGRLLEDMLKKYRESMNIYLTNAVKCFPRESSDMNNTKFRKPTEKEIECCNYYLAEEVDKLRKDAVIMPLGNTALSALYGEIHEKISTAIGKVHHVTLGSRTFKVVPNYHPSYVLRHPQMRETFDKMMILAWDTLFNMRKK